MKYRVLSIGLSLVLLASPGAAQESSAVEGPFVTVVEIEETLALLEKLTEKTQSATEHASGEIESLEIAYDEATTEEQRQALDTAIQRWERLASSLAQKTAEQQILHESMSEKLTLIKARNASKAPTSVTVND